MTRTRRHHHREHVGHDCPYRPEFREEDVVMVCEHLWNKPTLWKEIKSEPLNPPKTYHREDGTSFEASWSVSCAVCQSKPAEEVNYVECYWRYGRMHIADFCRNGNCPDELMRPVTQ